MLKQQGSAIMEWMCARSRRFNPRYFYRKRTEERARDTHRVDRRAKIVAVIWKRGFASGARGFDLSVGVPDTRRNPLGNSTNLTRKTRGARKPIGYRVPYAATCGA